MKVIVITGASSGIGLATAKYLTQKGFKVYAISRSKVFEKNIKSIQADVTDFVKLQSAYQDIFEVEGKIDVLINNAGMGISGSIEDTDPKDAQYLMDVNFMGVFNSTKAALPLMRAHNKGKIINISSVAGRLSIPFQAFYSSSKAAMNAFTEALHNEVSPYGIQVCSVLPGDIKTGFTKHRQKNDECCPVYRNRVSKSIAVMEKDEHNGMEPEYAAKIIKKLIDRKRLPLYKTIGFKYKIFVLLHKLLPARLANNIVGVIYGFKKTK
jgi:short-subunit dehydrogenase